MVVRCGATLARGSFASKRHFWKTTQRVGWVSPRCGGTASSMWEVRKLRTNRAGSVVHSPRGFRRVLLGEDASDLRPSVGRATGVVASGGDRLSLPSRAFSLQMWRLGR